MARTFHVPRLRPWIRLRYVPWHPTANPATMSTPKTVIQTHDKTNGGKARGVNVRGKVYGRSNSKSHRNVLGKTPTLHHVPMSCFDPAVGPSQLAPCPHPQGAGIYIYIYSTLGRSRWSFTCHPVLSGCRGPCHEPFLVTTVGPTAGLFVGLAVDCRDVPRQRRDMPRTRPRHCR